MWDQQNLCHVCPCSNKIICHTDCKQTVLGRAPTMFPVVDIVCFPLQIIGCFVVTQPLVTVYWASLANLFLI